MQTNIVGPINLKSTSLYPKILFIGHDGMRTGAPIILLDLITWIKSKYNIEPTVLLFSGGDLESRFRKIAPTYVWNRQAKTLLGRLISKIESRLLPFKIHQYFLRFVLGVKKFDLIYVNSVASLPLFLILPIKGKCPTICHVHELEYGIKNYCGEAIFNKAKSYIDKFIAVADVVKNNLVNNYALDSNKIVVIHAFISNYRSDTKPFDGSKIRIKKELNIPDSGFLICGAGLVDWRKGVDLFVYIASLLHKKYNVPIIFIWVGKINEIVHKQFLFDIEKLRLSEYIHFVGEQENILDYLALCNIFLLTSREDPFPLVCLEAASLGKPILCFNESGGIPEFVGDNCGYIVPYLDVQAMVEKIYYLYNNKKIVDAFGANVKENAKGFNIEIKGDAILKLIQAMV